MYDLGNKFLVSFVPLFVAIDAVGIVGIFINLTARQSEAARKKLLTEATLTALGVSIIFLFFGKLIFKLLGISESDFRIAGGIILLILAILDVLFPDLERQKSTEGAGLGVVPIGIPLIMGPAALTTILVSSETLGWRMTLASLLVNLAITWVIFSFAPKIVSIIGTGGTKAVAKVMALFLAAIGVMMIRVGIAGATNKVANIKAPSEISLREDLPWLPKR